MLINGNADIYGLEEYGLQEGAGGWLVIYDSTIPSMFRLLVLKRGQPVAHSDHTAVVYNGAEEQIIDFKQNT